MASLIECERHDGGALSRLPVGRRALASRARITRQRGFIGHSCALSGCLCPWAPVPHATSDNGPTLVFREARSEQIHDLGPFSVGSYSLCKLPFPAGASGRLHQHQRATLDAKAASLDGACRPVGHLDTPVLAFSISQRQLHRERRAFATSRRRSAQAARSSSNFPSRRKMTPGDSSYLLGRSTSIFDSATGQVGT